MRLVITMAFVFAAMTLAARAEDAKKDASKVVLKSPDGKTSYDLAKLTAQGPVLVRLTCACSGCDLELPYFKKLQAAYNGKGLQTIAVFREKAEALEQYASKKGLNFLWLSDPKGDLWKTFDSKAMPTNILIDKGGRIVRIVPGCTKDGKNAQTLSNEIATILRVPAAQVAESKAQPK